MKTAITVLIVWNLVLSAVLINTRKHVNEAKAFVLANAAAQDEINRLNLENTKHLLLLSR